jgi:uncharacterized protein (TIGR02246 family)
MPATRNSVLPERYAQAKIHLIGRLAAHYAPRDSIVPNDYPLIIVGGLMKALLSAPAFLAFALFAFSCQPQPATLTDSQKASPGQLTIDRGGVEASLDSLMRAYAAAFEARDAERVVGFYAPGAETFGWSDEQRLDYEPYVAALRGFLRTSHAISIRYENVRAHAITNDVGAIRTTLRESWTDSTDKKIAIRVIASWVARRREGQWRLVYFDGRHVPASADSLRTP